MANHYARVRSEGMFEPGCLSEVMAGCVLVGASYALSTAQSHAVGYTAATVSPAPLGVKAFVCLNEANSKSE